MLFRTHHLRNSTTELILMPSFSSYTFILYFFFRWKTWEKFTLTPLHFIYLLKKMLANISHYIRLFWQKQCSSIALNGFYTAAHPIPSHNGLNFFWCSNQILCTLHFHDIFTFIKSRRALEWSTYWAVFESEICPLRDQNWGPRLHPWGGISGLWFS